jgi:hypothetical protein
MRIGLISDIHEDADGLRRALDSLRRAGSDRIVSLGDVCENGEGIVETCRLLDRAGVVGVWGNHDYGLCTSPLDRLRRTFDPRVLETMRRFTPSLVIEDCRFAHIEPGRDPNDFGDLWNSDGPPVEPERLSRMWSAVPESRMFMGHLHRWFATTPEGACAWNGEQALALERGRRYLIVVGAVCDGCWALFDTTSGILVPNA